VVLYTGEEVGLLLDGATYADVVVKKTVDLLPSICVISVVVNRGSVNEVEEITVVTNVVLMEVNLLVLVGVDTLVLTYGVLVDTGVEVLTILDVDGE